MEYKEAGIVDKRASAAGLELNVSGSWLVDVATSAQMMIMCGDYWRFARVLC